MKYFLILSLSALILFPSCSDEKEAKKQALFKEVMDIHDEVMPEMGPLRQTRKSLLAMADSLQADTARAVQERVANLQQLALNIENANEQMMDWMRNFQEVPADKSNDEAIAYYEEQKQSITAVRDAMNQSLAQGQNALQQ